MISGIRYKRASLEKAVRKPLRTPLYFIAGAYYHSLHQLIATWESYQQVLLRMANPQTPFLTRSRTKPLPGSEVVVANSEESGRFLDSVFGTMVYLYLLTLNALIMDDGLDTMNTVGRIGNAPGGCRSRLDFFG